MRNRGFFVNVPASVGIDAGSTTFKAVIIDAKGLILRSFLESADPRIEEQQALALESLNAPKDIPVVATGYGRNRIAAAKTLTEITCHARGAFFRMGEPGILIDIGGQDTKIIRVGRGGAVLDFAMNDKCAAGTGRFLEVILARLRVPMKEIAKYAARSNRPVSINSTCTVFSESEVISLLANGEALENIVAGLHAALANRIASMVGSVSPNSRLFISGGVALNSVMVDALSKELSHPLYVVPGPQLVGALGAALSALPDWSKAHPR
ncbi:MAG: acyl-CoA dehydratase activase [Syntrophorhabdaceae bacterium]|nr:acyl-CoA dehydratase activase [Syntrophorhabdaceae bacterium]